MPYMITNDCIACGDCTVICPRWAIVEGGRTYPGSGGNLSLAGATPGETITGTPGDPAAFYRITADCNACGCCREVCPAGAIVWQD